MRSVLPADVEAGRITDDPTYGTHPHSGPTGAYLVYTPSATSSDDLLKIIANSACKMSSWWEHVSVSCPNRTPTWEEMCYVKDAFWQEGEGVVQFHPPKSQYVNHHPYCLHLWRNLKRPPLMPPSILVGPKK